MTPRWRAYALHVLAAIDKIQRIQQRGELTQDEVLYDATLRNLQTLSEATQHLPAELKHPYAAIPWQQISGFRNVLVHSYLGDIDPLTVEAIVSRDLPPLAVAVRAMLENLDVANRSEKG